MSLQAVIDIYCLYGKITVVPNAFSGRPRQCWGCKYDNLGGDVNALAIILGFFLFYVLAPLLIFWGVKVMAFDARPGIAKQGAATLAIIAGGAFIIPALGEMPALIGLGLSDLIDVLSGNRLALAATIVCITLVGGYVALKLAIRRLP